MHLLLQRCSGRVRPASAHSACTSRHHVERSSFFQSVASNIGVYRHVVTLVANQLVITDTTRAACGWKTFYDRTWSAVEAVAAGKPASNELHAAVADVLATTPINLLEKVLFDLRQQETAQLETHTIEHIETFPDRLLHVMRVRIAEAMPHLKWSAIEALGKRAATYPLSCPTHPSTAESAIHAWLDNRGLYEIWRQAGFFLL